MAGCVVFSERVISVGMPTPLAGVFTAPDNPLPNSPTLVLLNSGMMHHVGTCNLSVKLARSAALTRFSSFRFDFSGIGDSRTRSFPGTHEQREISEVREVMDELSRQEEISGFLLCGLCSGADAALATAAADERVVGIVQLDPLCKRTIDWYFHHYYQKVADIRAWRRLLARVRGKRTREDGLPSQYLEEVDEQERHDLDQSALADAYRKLVARDVHTLVIMTEGQRSCYNARGQFRRSFGNVEFGSTLDEHHLPRTRHIITEPDDQRFVVDLVTDWVTTQHRS